MSVCQLCDTLTRGNQPFCDRGAKWHMEEEEEQVVLDFQRDNEFT